MRLSDLDKNFKPCSAGGVEYVLLEPASLLLEGFPWEKENREKYRRLPDSVVDRHARLEWLSGCSAGGVLRFCTDSRALFLQGRYRDFDVMPHMPLTGTAGFDVAVRENGRERLLANLHPEAEPIVKKSFDFSFSCPLLGEMREYRIYLPLYAGVESLSVGLEKGASLEMAPPHRVKKPILFYGSSITEGGCASRPSNCHAALLAKWFDAEQINLGFSGSAKGELEIAQAIGALALSCFVLDYDFNADTVEWLQQTHEPFFRAVRDKHPELPVVFVSRPFANAAEYEEAVRRRDVIAATYLRAKERGDRQVYFVDGLRFFDEVGRDAATVDLTHPNDLGFYCMAKGIAPVLGEALHFASQALQGS